MVDETACNGLGVHELCCPPGEEVPKCGWYDFNNGDCGGTCPVGMFEIGSLDKHCGPSYQPACCFGTDKSMQLYNQCSWTKEFPNCNKGKCASDVTEIVRSGTGSGDAWCSAHGGNDPFSNKKRVREERKYCCREDIKDQKWTDCDWESHTGVVPKGWGGNDYCLSGCPSNKLRVSMDHNIQECSRGARSMCCTPAYSTIVKRETKDDELAEALEIFLDNPKCTNDTQSYRYDSQATVIHRLLGYLFLAPKTRHLSLYNLALSLYISPI
jgi:chitinase